MALAIIEKPAQKLSSITVLAELRLKIFITILMYGLKIILNIHLQRYKGVDVGNMSIIREKVELQLKY